jgi:hypothetical protein
MASETVLLRFVPFADCTFLHSSPSKHVRNYNLLKKSKKEICLRNLLPCVGGLFACRYFNFFFQCGMDKLSCLQEKANINRTVALKQALHWCCYRRSLGSNATWWNVPEQYGTSQRSIHPTLLHIPIQFWSIHNSKTSVFHNVLLQAFEQVLVQALEQLF